MNTRHKIVAVITRLKPTIQVRTITLVSRAANLVLISGDLFRAPNFRLAYAIQRLT